MNPFDYKTVVKQERLQVLFEFFELQGDFLFFPLVYVSILAARIEDSCDLPPAPVLLPHRKMLPEGSLKRK
jgi:hypothetical protein